MMSGLKEFEMSGATAVMDSVMMVAETGSGDSVTELCVQHPGICRRLRSSCSWYMRASIPSGARR